MENQDLRYDKDVLFSLKVIWDFMKLNQTIEPCDIIFACGCSNMDIPRKCVELFKNGYGKKILFSGGLGKITKSELQKTEAEIYRDIAISEGVLESDIFIENQSTNTGDNFRFSEPILEKNNVHSILIVHFATSERRTLAAAQAVLPNYRVLITSPDLTFSEFLSRLQQDVNYFNRKVSLLVGDIQRMVIYPQFGWQKEVEIPTSIIQTYYFLKEKGFTQFIYSPSDILELSRKHSLVFDDPNLFS